MFLESDKCFENLQLRKKKHSDFLAKWYIFFARSLIFLDKLSKLKSSSVSSSLDSLFNVFLVKTKVVNS